MGAYSSWGFALCLLAAAFSARAEPPKISGKWTTAAPLPDQRSEVSMVSDGSRLYLLGGFASDGANGAIAPKAVYSYDPKIDRWSRLTVLPAGVNHAGLAYFENRLYVIGGYAEATSQATDKVYIYNIGSDVWDDGPSLPTARGALAVTVQNGQIHAIGGVDTNKQNTGAHEVFDPSRNIWTKAADLPTPRDHMTAIAIDDEIIVPAGRNGSSSTLTVNEIYNRATDSWRRGADIPTGRSGIAGVELHGRAYLFGGETFDPPSTFNNVERYDLKGDSWSALPPMPIARHGLGAGALSGSIHVVAGGPKAGLSFSDVHDVLTPAQFD